MEKKICLLGLGHIGLPMACLMAGHGYQVVGVDIDEEVVKAVNKGEPHFVEPGLDELLRSVVDSGALVAKGQPEGADIFIVAVSTPLGHGGRMADLSHVSSAAQSILPYLRKDNLVINESTVPIGATERVFIPILERSGLRAGHDWQLAYSPERAMPGSTLYEIIHNDRIVGALDEALGRRAREVYSCFVKGAVHLTSIKVAEAAKLMENTYRDVNIALANEFARIVEAQGVDVWEAIALANKHPRVNILKPGPGAGGYCIPKDPLLLIEGVEGAGRLISLARETNDSMPRHVLEMVKRAINRFSNPVITVFGVAYKGDVDDVRESPALNFLRQAESQGYAVRAYDPLVHRFPHQLLDLREAVRGSDCIVLMADHSHFRELEPRELAPLMRNKILVDSRNFLDHGSWRRAGFTVLILGNGKANA